MATNLVAQRIVGTLIFTIMESATMANGQIAAGKNKLTVITALSNVVGYFGDDNARHER